MEVLKIEGLKKAFGSSEVIKGIDLSVTEGKIFGFIGQNGAGKTTTMKMILGLLEKDQGEIYVCGEPVKYGETRTNRYIGYLPDVPEFYSYMTPMEYLSLCGEITGMEKEKIKKRSEELLSLVGLPISKKRIGTFSRGMKQRLGIAQALLNEPKLLICDEPTSALDPMGRMEILRILQSVKGKTTVIFSTHILSDVEESVMRWLFSMEDIWCFRDRWKSLRRSIERKAWMCCFKRKKIFMPSWLLKSCLLMRWNGMETDEVFL